MANRTLKQLVDCVSKVNMLSAVPTAGSFGRQITRMDAWYAAMWRIVSRYAKYTIINACKVLDT